MTPESEVDKLLLNAKENVERKGASLLDIVIYPNPLLKEKSALILGSIPHDNQLQNLLNDMVHTMVSTRAMGLSAVQVGHTIRALVIMDGDNPIKMINPTIVSESGKQYETESCLSIPFIGVKIQRADHIGVNFQNEQGISVYAEYSGLTSIAIQHEINHLNGLTIFDLVPKINRQPLIKKFNRNLKRARQIHGF